MKRRVLGFIMAFSMLLSVFSAFPFCVSAGSTPSDWALTEVQSAINEGLVTEKVTLDYQKSITREEFCELVVKLYQKITGKDVSVGNNPFVDTQNETVLKAYFLDIVKGVSDNEFAPDNTITRQEICVMLVRAIEAILGDEFILSYDFYQFDDGEDIADWALEQVFYAYEKGIIKGVGDHKIDPLGTATCEQAILTIGRIYKNIDLCKDKYSDEINALYDNYTFVHNGLSEVSKEYMGEHGYISQQDIGTVLELASQKALEMKEVGIVDAVSYNETYCSISIELKNGYKYVFAPPIKGFDSAGTNRDTYDVSIMTVDYLKLSEEIGEEAGSTIYNTVLNKELEYTTMNDCVNMIEGRVPNHKTYWKKNGTSISKMKNAFLNLNENQKYVILWRGHGNLYEHTGNHDNDLGAVFWVSEMATKWKMNTYAEDLKKDNVILYNGDFAISNKFFDEYMADVKSGLFYAACCYSAADNNKMSLAILEKGFSCYLGSTTKISHGYNTNMMYRIIKFLCEFEDAAENSTRKISDALALAKGNGYATDWEGPATIQLVQNNEKADFRLSGEWKEAYAEFLDDEAKNYKKKQSGYPHFALAYINDDEIPELVVIYNSSHADGAYLYTYLDDEVVPVNWADRGSNRYGVYGTFLYKERESLIYTGNMHHGYSSDSIWSVDEDMVATQKYLLQNDAGAVPNDNDVTYSVNGVKVTKEQYNARYKEYGFDLVKGEYKRIEYGTASEVTEDNIKTVLKIK